MEKIVNNQTFIWDDVKNSINRRKHGIDFEDAAKIFADDNRIEFLDSLHSDEEDRYITIGRVRNILFVVYTEREDKIRLITARKANKEERELYYAGGEDY